MSNWAPHIFRERAKAKGCDEDFIDALVAEGNRLQSLNLPVIFTLRHLGLCSDTPHGVLEAVVSRAADPYRVFKLRKRGIADRYRLITVPDSQLANVQKWIQQNILLQTNPHRCSTAFFPGCSPFENARRHRKARWLVKIDVTDFFESVSEQQVFKVFKNMGFKPLLAFQLARLCTRLSSKSHKYKYARWHVNGQKIGHLPQGASTSPLLANLVCRDLDESLSALALSYGCSYSRYADDIVFSTSKFTRELAVELIGKTSAHLQRMGFRRNRRKTQISPPGARKIVTGLLVDQAEPRLPREFKEKINLHLYHAKSKSIASHCRARGFRSLFGFRAHLHGLITFAEHIDPIYGASCRAQYDALNWGELTDIPLFYY